MSGWTLRPFIHSDEKQTTLGVRGDEELGMVNLFTHSFRREVVGDSEDRWALDTRRQEVTGKETRP